MISIKNIKKNFSYRYPENSLTKVLLNENDELSEEEFLAKVITWLLILENNKNEIKIEKSTKELPNKKINIKMVV